MVSPFEGLLLQWGLALASSSQPNTILPWEVGKKMINAFFFPLRNVVLVKCRCSKCRGSAPSCLKQKRPPNGKGASNTMERSIKSSSSHHCQALSRCSVQMIPQNICAISSTCCKLQNVTLQDLTINFRPCVEKTKPSKLQCISEKNERPKGKKGANSS